LPPPPSLSISRLLLPLFVIGAASVSAQSPDDLDVRSAPPEVISSPSTSSSVYADAEGRVLGVIPAHKIIATDSLSIPPLTSGGKFHLAFKDSIDPFTFVSAGFYAGIAQWQNDYPGYGQGAQGYSKRFAAAYADQVLGNFFTEAIFPSVLHQDPRYFRRGTGSTLSRFRYAVSRTVITRTDSGKNTFNASEFLGNAAAAGISTLYYPATQRNAAEVGEKFAMQVAGDTAFNVLIEFWPDMRHKLLHKQH
jgi:hypothetical protein